MTYLYKSFIFFSVGNNFLSGCISVLNTRFKPSFVGFDARGNPKLLLSIVFNALFVGGICGEGTPGYCMGILVPLENKDDNNNNILIPNTKIPAPRYIHAKISKL